ncbi:terminase large subunit domain-containing protein [Mucilaginibacter defluvii]
MDVNINLPKPHTGQQKVLDSKARFKVLLCGRRWGKSLISQIISILGMLNKKHIAYVTPTYQLSKIFFQEIIKVIPVQLIQSANKTDLIITLKTGGSLSFLTGERLDSFRGRKFHTVIIDEAAYISDIESAWLNSIRPCLTDYAGDALFISTPRGKNYFYSLYLKGLDESNTEWESFHYSTYDNPYISKSEIESAKASLPDSAYQQEYLAIANANSNSVVASHFIEANTITTLSKKKPVVYGIDIAKYHDYTCITGLDSDGAMCYFERFQRDNEYTKQRIKALPSSILKVIDSTHGSVGDGIFESLQSEGVPNILGFEFTSATKPKLITELILDIEKGNLKFNEITANELSIFEYSYTSTGYIKYGNAPGGFDDCVIALALANRYKKQIPINFLAGFSFG